MSLTQLALANVYRLLPDLLGAFEHADKKCYLIQLAPELLTEEVFTELTVEDILSLRRTSKFFYGLTHAPIIWRRLLRRIDIPLPPIRPTFRYDLRETDLEIEQLVARGLSMDYNWRKPTATAQSYTKLVQIHTIREMRLLPGSKFLIASTQLPGMERYFIQILTLDTRNNGRVLCEIEIKNKAFNLTSKYTTYQGKYGIVTAFQTRSVPPGEKYEKYKFFNPNVFSANAAIDAPGPILHEVTCFFTPLHVLEAAIIADSDGKSFRSGYPKVQDLPKPFIEMAHMQSMTKFGSLTLFEEGRVPYATAVLQPRTVLLVNLHTKEISSIHMKEYRLWTAAQTCIHAIHPMPGKNTMIVIRTLMEGTLTGLNNAYHCVESVKFELGKVDVESDTDVRLQFRELPGGAKGVEFSFNDPEVRPRVPADHHPTLHQDNRNLLPISIFGKVQNPPAFYHWNIWPACMPQDGHPTLYEFGALDNHVTPQSLRMTSPLMAPYILPGTSHSLVFMVDKADRKECPRPLQFYRYVNPEAYPDDPSYEWPPGGEQAGLDGIMRRPRLRLPTKRFSKIDMPTEIMEALDETQGDINAVAWDGHSGRLCFAMSKTQNIHVVDFGSCSRPDQLLWRWMKKREEGKDVAMDGGDMGLNSLFS